MRVLIKSFLALSLLSINIFAADGKINVNQRLDYKTKQKIIEKLIESDVAQNDYFGGTAEASVSEVMARNYTNSLSNIQYDGSTYKMYLDCKKTDQKSVLRCSLTYLDSVQDSDGGPSFESAIWIEGDVNFSELSTEIFVSNVKANYAG